MDEGGEKEDEGVGGGGENMGKSESGRDERSRNRREVGAEKRNKRIEKEKCRL